MTDGKPAGFPLGDPAHLAGYVAPPPDPPSDEEDSNDDEEMHGDGPAIEPEPDPDPTSCALMIRPSTAAMETCLKHRPL